MAIDQACASRFNGYVDLPAEVVGHADRRAPLFAYCHGLILPGDRKSVEPMAARIDSGALAVEERGACQASPSSGRGWSTSATSCNPIPHSTPDGV